MDNVIDLSKEDVTGKEETHNCYILKCVKTFLEDMNRITHCPITHMRFEEPMVGSDKQIYKKNAITRWLSRRVVNHPFVNQWNLTL